MDHILKFMTLGTVMIGCVAILTALYTNNRRLGADIFLKYSIEFPTYGVAYRRLPFYKAAVSTIRK